MRLVKELVLRAWHARRAEVGREIAETERRANGVQQKLDRLDEASLFTESIDLQTYERQRDRLRPELTPIDIDRHSAQVEKPDVEGILAFAGR
jgi:queuine/archaeosine tRNA-ribosyltransferase